MEHSITDILRARSTGRLRGIWSCCSANEYVIRAALRRSKAAGIPALVEATANQVNQFGGYTGMQPADFRRFVLGLAKLEDFDPRQLFLGGDHLGPLTWQDLPEAEAMENARALVSAYVRAGFSKIHLDTSMRVADDSRTERLADEVIARRSAFLCRAAEEAFAAYRQQVPDAPAPVYIIGSEVPIPGGAQENEDRVTVTDPADCERTLAAFRAAYRAAGLDDAVWLRIAAIVVQPGVEFADNSVVCYQPEAARSLLGVLGRHPELVFEGHSTDYQPKGCLKAMAADGIAILKVGPALTYALREGLFALEQIECELLSAEVPHSRFRRTLDEAMCRDDRHWRRYYPGTPEQQRFSRAFSFSDRARYYLAQPEIAASIETLLSNLSSVSIPRTVLSQYLPRQYERVRDGQLRPAPEDLLLDRIGDAVDPYLHAVLRD